MELLYGQNGVIGSISHCETMCIVAVTKLSNSRLKSLGIDVEPNRSIGSDLTKQIASDKEISQLLDSRLGFGKSARLLFSAKEAIYKCLFPITNKFLEFTDIDVKIDFVESRFHIESGSSSLLNVLNRYNVSGRFIINDNHIITAADLS